jgi:L-seryl-tRNA(Ser) seleniumtransferase
MNELLRKIPKVDDILKDEKWGTLAAYPAAVAKDALRAALDDLRSAIKEGSVLAVPDVGAIIEETRKRATGSLAPALKRVINGTGVVIHTNLGRSPLAPSVIDRVAALASGYSNLEYNLEAGTRGDRHQHCLSILSRLTEAEGTLVVNNNAAAVLLALNTLAEGKEVIIARGELIEIGGSFRIPEVMRKSGAILREVGTTNRTFLQDYEAAVGPNTGLIMKAHTSNYRIKGFVHEVGSDELADFSGKVGIPFFFDIGSGLFSSLGGSIPDSGEPSIAGEMKKGVDVISFSGDKLLGGPQAGVIVGKKDLVDAMKKNPLTRALRPDKLTLAALEATLLLYLDKDRAEKEVPILRMLLQDPGVLKNRASRVGRALRKEAPGSVGVEVVPLTSEAGGGSFPDIYLPSFGIACQPAAITVERLEARLRALGVPIIGRIEKDRLLIDMRTIREEEEHELIAGLRAALADGK